MGRDGDKRWMALALSLGRRGEGQTWPNPSVGCVIVQGDRLVGRGWTQAGGRPHAEAMALQQAGDLAKGATVYVSLEPCAHHGKTAPCVDALINSGVSRVVFPVIDPDPRVAGQGKARLESGGVEVDTGLMAEVAEEAHAGFFSRTRSGRPFVTLKIASTLDGKIGTSSGESQWITGPDARRRVHALRSSHDAVMIGAGTARSDDPELTARDLGPTRQPVRIVISSSLHMAGAAKLKASAKDVPVWIFHTDQAEPETCKSWEASGAKLVRCSGSNEVDLPEALSQIAGLGITRVLCEGGAGLSAALIKAGLADQLIVFSAGKVIGQEGLSAVSDLGLAHLNDAPLFRLDSVEATGSDILSIWKIVRPTQE